MLAAGDEIMRKCRITADSPEALAKAVKNQAWKVNDDTLFWYYDEQTGKWVAEYEEG